ncbi:helix-turn-helix domain-containing protein [Nubsella zeaxanthinifaciens]|uniref:helix-turn-helix domain-containing protein n=1 Tax=Nubsella zeaxanthinifaciens TaxID=392412 RepID=UPI000DE42377|nr:DUF4248 domain-containing protein [Nubsella zeaxanthinifaciens]
MQTADFTIKAYTKKQLAAFYGVSRSTFRRWINQISDLGEYIGKTYTPAQVKKIVEHLGTP